MHSRQQSRLDPSPFIVRTVIGFRHSIAGQPAKKAASCSVRSAIVVFPEIASFILIVHENAARLLLRPHQLRQLGDVGAKRRASSWIKAPHAPVCDASHSEAPPISYGSVTNRRGRHEEIAAVLALVFAVVAGTATVLTVVTPQSAIADACTSGNC
jgi:hypothetical protein